jgi:hypothetical protein
MLEHIPAWLGHAMSGLRAGADKLAIVQLGGNFETLDLTSPAFAHEARLPPRFTADGEGVSGASKPMRGGWPRARSSPMMRATLQGATWGAIHTCARAGCHPIHPAGMASTVTRSSCSRSVRGQAMPARHPGARR